MHIKNEPLEGRHNFDYISAIVTSGKHAGGGICTKGFMLSRFTGFLHITVELFVNLDFST
jgi:hypothetical protein